VGERREDGSAVARVSKRERDGEREGQVRVMQ